MELTSTAARQIVGAGTIKSAAGQLCAAVLGFILSYSGGFAGISPFGIAAVAAMPFPYCTGAAVGACVGYALGAENPVAIFRFAAAVLAVALLRILAECFIKIPLTKFLYSAGALTACLATGISVQLSLGIEPKSLISLACESLLAGGGCMLFLEILPFQEKAEGFAAAQWLEKIRTQPKSRLALVFSLAILIAALAPLQFMGIKFAMAVAALLILLAAYVGGAEGGSVAGIAFSAALLLRGESVTIALMLCLGGVLAGAFSPLGRYASGGFFAASAGFLALLYPTTESVAFLSLCIVGIALFLCIPAHFLDNLRNLVQLIPAPKEDAKASELLTDTAAALKQVRECVERVSLSLEDLSAKHALNAGAQNEDVQARTRTLREAVSEQLGGMEEILRDLGGILTAKLSYLPAQSARAKAETARAGLECRSADCVRDRWGHLRLSLSLDKPPVADLDTAEFFRNLEIAAGVGLQEISFSDEGDKITWIFAESPRFSVEIGVAQRARGDARLCGDYYSQFTLPGGETAFLLSDGMGTGGRAAVDSALTCTLFSTLVQAGLSFPCALRLTNGALMSKSADESLATLDAAIFDPYTGEMRLYKAGAAASLAAVGRNICKLESDSLPAGILREIDFKEHSLKLKEGDLCLLFSDGAVIEDEEITKKLLIDWTKSADELAGAALMLALERVPEDEQDDATVAALGVVSIVS
ncbi:MAG: SpoIIE family protein phosphatase [Oscillospiraceae bacterium]|nr:SpoIIE family protein phosphatase [Oscillospiraceae bacterium]